MELFVSKRYLVSIGGVSKAIFTLLVSAIVAFGVATPSQASPTPMDKKFANCTELNKVYPGGVSKNSKATNKGGATNYTPLVKPKIYKANASKDRDKDGLACER
jgi:hypothetical protein